MTLVGNIRTAVVYEIYVFLKNAEIIEKQLSVSDKSTGICHSNYT